MSTNMCAKWPAVFNGDSLLYELPTMTVGLTLSGRFYDGVDELDASWRVPIGAALTRALWMVRLDAVHVFVPSLPQGPPHTLMLHDTGNGLDGKVVN